MFIVGIYVMYLQVVGQWVDGIEGLFMADFVLYYEVDVKLIFLGVFDDWGRLYFGQVNVVGGYYCQSFVQVFYFVVGCKRDGYFFQCGIQFWLAFFQY